MAAISTSCRGFLCTEEGKTVDENTHTHTQLHFDSKSNIHTLPPRCGTHAHLLGGQRLSRGSTPSPAISKNKSTSHSPYKRRWLCILSVTYPCCVFTEVTTFVLYAVGVTDPLEKLDLLYNILPFLVKWTEHKNEHAKWLFGFALPQRRAFSK